jgi:hypothetical protein
VTNKESIPFIAIQKEINVLAIKKNISLRKIDQSDHYISCFDGKTKKKERKSDIIGPDNRSYCS